MADQSADTAERGTSPWHRFVLSCPPEGACEPDDAAISAMLDQAFGLHMRDLQRKPTLDVDLVGHCNLNCVSCCHFSPIAQHGFLALDDFERQIGLLARVDGVEDFFDAICLMGGEPLLHPELARFVGALRRLMPRVTIRLVTNGLLLEDAPDELWEALMAAGAQILITPYPVGLDYDALVRLAADRGVEASLGGGLSYDDSGDAYFLHVPIDPAGCHDPVESFVACPLGGSTMQMRDGRIYACNKAALLDRANERFGTQLACQPGDYLDLSSIASAREIGAFRRTSKPVCRHCAQKLARRVAWRASTCDASEWLVG